MGLDVDHERRGFDYDDTNAVARQFALLKAQVCEYQRPSGLLLWVIGNELNMENNPKVWDAVNDLSRMIHQVDPNHPTTTTLAGFKKETVSAGQNPRARSGFYLLPNVLRHHQPAEISARSGLGQALYRHRMGRDRPLGMRQDHWGAPIENDSTTKADLYKKRFEKVIQADHKLCLGSYVFLWGQQAGTHAHLVRHVPRFRGGNRRRWTSCTISGRALASQPQSAAGRSLAGRKDRLPERPVEAGPTYAAKVQASDPDHDPLTYSWEVMEESTERKIGGDAELRPQEFAGIDRRPDEERNFPESARRSRAPTAYSPTSSTARATPPTRTFHFMWTPPGENRAELPPTLADRQRVPHALKP